MFTISFTTDTVVPDDEVVLRTSADSPAAAHFTFVSMRSGSPTVLNLPPSGPIELRMQPAAHATVAKFRVTLFNVYQQEEQAPAHRPVGALSGLAPGADGYLSFYADSARLAAGSYELRVEPDSGADAAAETFAFRLRGSGGR